MHINKITPPSVAEAVMRERLFARLDAASSRPIMWIHAPGGSGKSTLVASYLKARKLPSIWYQLDKRDEDPASLFYYLGMAIRQVSSRESAPLPFLTAEYQMGIEPFSRHFFEDFFQRLPSPGILVLDDYQEVAADTPAQEVFLQAFQEIPEGVKVMICSRNAPPPLLARFRVRRKMEMIGWKELQLTSEETEAVLRLYDPSRNWDEAANVLHARTHGWIAGLILILERGRTGDPGDWLLGKHTPEEIFDFFAAELFAGIEAPVRNFLLEVSYFPEISPSLAARLTGNSEAGRILSSLHRKNYFTELRFGSSPVYKFHPLFRDFLRHRAESGLAPEDSVRLRRETARLLVEAGRKEDAAELFVEAADWKELLPLVVQEAEGLVRQGRTRTLAGWLARVPESLLAQEPWPLFWSGVCRLGVDFEGARSCFIAALALFRENQEPAGMFLSWANIVDTFPYEMDDWRSIDEWIGVMDELLREYPEFPAKTIELQVTCSFFVSLVLRQTDKKRIALWAEKVFGLLDHAGDPNAFIQAGFFLALYHMWTGSYRKNDQLFENLRRKINSPQTPPLAVITMHMMEAMHGWLTGRAEACQQAVAHGLALAEENGIRLWNNLLQTCLAEAAMLQGDLAAVEEKLHAMAAAQLGESRSLDRLYFHTLSAWHALLKGNLAKAWQHLEHQAPSVAKLGSHFHEIIWHLGRTQVLLLQGQIARASEDLQHAYRVALEMNSLIMQYMCLLTQARIAFHRGDDAGGLHALKQALAIGREQDYIHFVWWQPTAIADLCVRALQAGIETDYVRSLIVRRKLVPQRAPLDIPDWPWPVRIFSLGRFAVEIDGEPVKFSGKVQKKPLELLKALIAFGGREVSTDQLIDTLWFEADGDAAYRSFKITLHRLRQLLGHEGAVCLREGRLSLDLRYVWTDVWALEQAAHELPASWKSAAAGDVSLSAPLAERVFALYRGPFLAAESDSAWAGPMRGRLRGQFERLVMRLTDSWGASGEWHKAVECCQDALEMDELSEALHRRLMVCLDRAGRGAEAIGVYHRCRELLASRLATEPSVATEEIFQQIVRGKSLP